MDVAGELHAEAGQPQEAEILILEIAKYRKSNDKWHRGPDIDNGCSLVPAIPIPAVIVDLIDSVENRCFP